MCDFRWGLQQLCPGSERKSGHSRGHLRSRLPTASRAVDLFHYSSAAENSGRAWHHQARTEPDFVSRNFPQGKSTRHPTPVTSVTAADCLFSLTCILVRPPLTIRLYAL